MMKIAKSKESDKRVAPALAQRLILFADSKSGTLLLAFLFALAMIHNYVFPLNSLLYTTGIKGQDCGQMIWNIWFSNEAISSGHSPFSTNLLFYPLGANLAHHTLAAGFFPVTFLVKKLSGNDPMYPFYAFKIIILLSFTLILWFSYLTLRELGLTRWAALIPATAYAFSDFYKLHVIHINHLAGFFIPLTALFLIRAYKKPASTNLIVAALLAACSIYFTEFSVYIFMAVLFIGLIAGLFPSRRQTLLQKLRAVGSPRLIVSGIVFTLIAAPFLINLFKDKVRKPPYDEPSHYSANVAGFFIPGQERDQAELYGAPLTTPLYGRAFVSLDSRVTMGIGGFEIFVGFPLLVFGVIALVKSKQRFLVWLNLAGGLLFFVLSLGPTLKIFGVDTGVPLPYAVLMKIPPFDTGRTPVRFVVMGLFFLMIVAAWGVEWLENVFANRVRRRWAWLAMTLLFVWTIAEAYSPTQRRKPLTPPRGLSAIVAGPVLNLPPVQWDGYAALLQTFHHQPIATGYLARNSEAQWAHFGEFKIAFDKGGPAFCEYVRSSGFRNIIIAPDSVTLPYHFSMTPLDLSRCNVNIVDLRERGPGPFGVVQADGTEQPEDFPAWPRGTHVDFGSEGADKYLWYGWSGRETLSHWTDRGKAALIFSVTPQTDQKQKFTLRIFGAPFLAPGKLDAQRVIVKLNDQEIANWRLTNAEPQMYSIDIAPSVMRGKNVLLFVLPDATSPRSLGVGEDWRLLGFNVQWIEIE